MNVQDGATCKLCGKPIERGKGPRKREYCNNAHKERAYRERKQAGAQPTLEQQNVQVALQMHVDIIEELRSRIDTLEAENRRLQQFIDSARDVEEAFNTNTREYGFKYWLLQRGAAWAERPGCKKFLNREMGMSARGSRGRYQDELRRAGFTADEQADFWDAWRAMLRNEMFKDYYATSENQL